MATKFVPLTFDLIDEGRFHSSVDEALQEAMHKLVQQVKKFGPGPMEGAKAEVQVKISLCFEGRDESDYSVKGSISTKLPGRPASVTVAIEGQEQTGEETLFVRASGSSKTTPKQQVLATEDGRTVDPKSGEAREKGK